jgi:hypothetical protein
MVDKQPNLSPPAALNRVPRSPEELIAMGAEFMAEYVDPRSAISDHAVVEFMLELFDNPTAIEAYDRELTRRAGGKDADRWH